MVKRETWRDGNIELSDYALAPERSTFPAVASQYPLLDLRGLSAAAPQLRRCFSRRFARLRRRIMTMKILHCA